MANRYERGGYIDYMQYERSLEGELDHAVENGNCDEVRRILDIAFWHDRKDLRPEWCDVKVALQNDDHPLLRLLITWGARAPQNEEEIKGLKPEKLALYAKVLRRYGLDAAVIEKAAAGPRPASVTEAPQPPEAGQKMPDGTIYLGQYKPKDHDGNSLSKAFNVFAAPEDLPETMRYVGAVKHIARLKKWNGYDGTNYATDKELYAAIKSGSYNGGWVIPTRDILHGKDVDGKETTPDNILAHKDKGSLKGTFKMTASGDGSDFPVWYWSSTEDRDYPSGVWVVRFSDGYGVWLLKDDSRLSCRPVRLVEACKAP